MQLISGNERSVIREFLVSHGGQRECLKVDFEVILGSDLRSGWKLARAPRRYETGVLDSRLQEKRMKNGLGNSSKWQKILCTA